MKVYKSNKSLKILKRMNLFQKMIKNLQVNKIMKCCLIEKKLNIFIRFYKKMSTRKIKLNKDYKIFKINFNIKNK